MAMLAVSVRLALRQPKDEAERMVSQAGSAASSMAQIEMRSGRAAQVSVKA